MSRIRVRMKNGSERTFEESERAGGSYCTTLTFVDGYAVITNAWDRKVYIPTADVAEIEEIPTRGGW